MAINLIIKGDILNRQNIQGFEKSPRAFSGLPTSNEQATATNTGYWQQTTGISPLITFRIFFGLMLLASIVRFWYKGWIDELYIKPTFFFSYYGFEWVKPLGVYTYALFAICALSAFLVAIGLFYRIAAIVLFLTFTYIELMDKTTYLNHYYFVSIVAFVMIWLPANAAFSVDAWRKKQTYTMVSRYMVDSLRVIMTILYVYAGLAKLNSDWLLHAQPLKTWLPAKNDLPIVGPLFNRLWVAYVFSWFGCIYDLTIPFLLTYPKTRMAAFALVVVFHTVTVLLFPIGMFPYIMIVSALIFFPAHFHDKILNVIRRIFSLKTQRTNVTPFVYSNRVIRLHKAALIFFIGFQLLVPFRYALYPGELFWNEEGYRFSWRVLLMEKTGYTIFSVYEPSSQRKIQVDNRQYLTALQEKQMSFQPDMILEFAHHIAAEYTKRGWKEPGVFAESYVTLNGRPGQVFIDPKVDLAKEKESFKHKSWIKNFDDEIQGF